MTAVATTTARPAVSRVRMALRLAAIVAIAGGQALVTLPAALVVRVVRGGPAARLHLYRGTVRGLQRLGPTFVKFGQIAAVRQDALPADLCEELSRLHDSVKPMTRRRAARAVRDARAGRPALEAVTVGLDPIGSGSIACVYRGVLPGAGSVALKLKRPGIDRRMRCDLALMELMARVGQRLPKLRGMPIADLVGYMSTAILGQLDFEREARHSTQIREALAAIPGVRVPELWPGLCSSDCLAFEYLPGLDADNPDRLPDAVRAQVADRVLAAVHKLVFEEGLVHCDLHPGNLYVTLGGQAVVLDAGFCVELPHDVRRLIGEFFVRLAEGDGARCGEIVLESAVHVSSSVDVERFVADFAELVARRAGPASAFDMGVFGDAVYDLQQRYGIYAASDFAFPLMSLLVVQGTVRGVWPGADFRAVGAPGPAERTVPS